MVSVEYILKKEHPALFTYPDIISKSVVGLTRFLIHENSINRFMQLHETKNGLEFIDAALNHLNVSYKVIHREIENVPAIGKVIIVANHPLGALDSLTLIQMVCSVRQDKKVKIIACKVGEGSGKSRDIDEYDLEVDALVYFYSHYFGSDHTMMRAKSPYHLSEFVQAEFSTFFKGDDYNEDFRRLKNYLKTFDLSVPTLYKQYTELCEEGGVEFMDFGIDVDFNNCIDGYIVVDIRKIKEVKRQRYMHNV